MKIIWRILLALALLVLLLLGFLYIAVNSSYLFDKAAHYFGPEYSIRYDKVSGNALTGIELDGLYYKEKKLARSIKIKLNPATLLEKKITISHLKLYGVNESYLESMISDFSSNEEDNSSSSFPFAIQLNDAELSLLPFKISGIDFAQSTLRVEDITYDEETFDFGALHLSTQTSLGHAEIDGEYHGRDLLLSNLDIQNLNTEAIEKLITDSNESSSTEQNSTEKDEPSIFIPKTLVAKHLKVTVLPRKYKGVALSLLMADGKDIALDFEKKTAVGDLNLSLRTDIAKVDTVLSFGLDQLQFQKININDVNLTKLLDAIPNDENRRNKTEKPPIGENPTDKIPYLSDNIVADSIEVNILPMKLSGIVFDKILLRAKSLQINLLAKRVSKGELDINIKSDIAQLTHQGSIKDNQLKSHIVIIPSDTLIKKYKLPLRKGAVQNISIDALTDKDDIDANISFAATKLLDTKKDAFNLDIKPSKLHLMYPFGSGILAGALDSNISTPYTDNAAIHLSFKLKDKLTYQGDISTKKITGIEPRLSSLLKRTKITFKGDMNSTNVAIESKHLWGDIQIKDFSKADIHLESKKELQINTLVKLPEALKMTKAKLVLDMPLDLNKTMPMHAKAKLSSNVLNVDADILYGKSVSMTAIAKVPSDSLLKNLDKNIQFAALTPMKITATVRDNKLKANIEANKLKIAANYNLKTGNINSDIGLADTNIKLSGKPTKALTLNTESSSIRKFIEAVNTIYRVDTPDIDGDIRLRVDMQNLSSVHLSLHSREIRIGKSSDKPTKLSNISLEAKGDKKGILLESYKLETEGINLYANKPSRVSLNGDLVILTPIWINDMLKTVGEYNLKSKKGKFKTEASSLKINHEMAEIATALGVDTSINRDKISFSGKIHLKDGEIKYNLNSKNFAADSDIIILQRQRKKNNYFKKNIAINATVDSKNPLRYKKGDINIKLMPNLKLKKRYGDSLKMYGKVLLLPGGFYTFQNKKFILKKSSIIFKGKVNAPILNISIIYHHAGTTIHVKVSGSASDPSLSFSSDPHMSREEILSLIMFDTESGGRGNSAGDVTNLVAGSLVKSLFGNMGLKLDHLVLSGAGFEVGKKLSDKITVIYDQKKESSIKIRIQNTKNIETDISFGSSSRSADIFYKKEF